MEEGTIEPDAPSSEMVSLSNTGGDHEDSGDEEAPDYTQLTALATKSQKSGLLSSSASAPEDMVAPFIPKRGEKDFEPTGFEAQARVLEKSRKAMFDVIKCERIVSSKSISIATWEPCLNRAIVELARGTIFSSIGASKRVKVLKDGSDEDIERYYNPARQDWEIDGVEKDGVFYEKTRTRIELLPEEALYLVERGSLECRIRSKKGYRAADQYQMKDYDADGNYPEDWIPMSVQQAFATMLFCDGLTRERYQLYAYLRRLGYVVQRKSTYDKIHATALSKRDVANKEREIETKGIIADPRRPLKLVTIFDILLYPFRRFGQVLIGGGQSLNSLIPSLDWLRKLVSRTSFTREQTNAGRGLLELGGRRWDRYEQIFDRLQIVPSGHDHTSTQRRVLQKNDEVPEIFYYAWRPATRYKKTDPPLPEYRIAIVDARNTALPSMYAFETLLQGVPIPLTGEDVEDLDENQKREWTRAQEEKKRNDESYGKGAVKKLKAEKAAFERTKRDLERSRIGLSDDMNFRLRSLYHRFLHLIYFINHCFTLLPPGCASINKPQRGSNSRPRPTNIFIPLKAGRRNVIVAVNDCGTTSLLRFGEAEFERWKLAGSNSA